jgi:hypothetical protein
MTERSAYDVRGRSVFDVDGTELSSRRPRRQRNIVSSTAYAHADTSWR